MNLHSRSTRNGWTWRMAALSGLLAVLAVGGVWSGSQPSALAMRDVSKSRPQSASRALFERRILPILRSPNASTCAECHLSGVDLKDYIHPSEAETFLSLRDHSLIDLKRPEKSHLLQLIAKSRPKTPLMTQKAREAELAAFRDWIVAASKNSSLVSVPRLPDGKRIGPKVSNAILRHTRLDRVVESFKNNIWSQEGRCMGCHRPGTPGNAENVKKFGARVSWFVPDSPEATMRKIVAQGLVDVNAPDKSLILLKPLNRVPHGGGVKMVYGDVSYKMFRAWIEDYAASIKNRYRVAKDLPAESRERLVFTECILAIEKAPAPWNDRLLRADIYPWDGDRNTWAEKPAATGERQIFQGGTNLLIFRLLPMQAGQTTSSASKSASNEAALPPGRYLLKYYVDTEQKLAGDYRFPTNSPTFYQGEQEITSRWEPGWGSLTKVTVRLAAAK